MLPSEYLKQGWCQGALKNQQGERCLLGAIRDSSYAVGRENYNKFTQAALDILEVRGYLSSIATWNNAPERTQGEVVALARLVEIKLGLRPGESAVYELEGTENALELVGAGD